MALEASHIRFALDLKDKYSIQDVQKLVSGTVYPDSRYATKIDRQLTHPQDFMDEISCEMMISEGLGHAYPL